jgi:hypothetical protein
MSVFPTFFLLFLTLRHRKKPINAREMYDTLELQAPQTFRDAPDFWLTTFCLFLPSYVL